MPERFGSNESTFDALRGQTLNLPVNGSAAGAGAADSTYLRLDATNDPVTGALDVKVDSADALRVLTSGSAEVFVADTLANLIMGRLNEVWVQETKYLVVDAGGLGDYTTIQAALNYIMGLAGPQTWTVLIRDGTYAEILTLTGSVSANRTVSLVGLGKETILAPGLSAAQHVINSGTYTTINCINIKIQPTGSSTGAIAGLGSGVGIYFWDCRIEPLVSQKLESGGSGSAYFARCEIGLAGRTYSDMVSSSGIGSAVYCYYCRIYGGASNGTGLVTGANLTNGTFLYHCEVFNGGGAASYDLRNANGGVTVGRCLYNRTKTSGTVTVLDGDIPALTTTDLPATTVTGTGTTDRVAKFTGASTIGDSNLIGAGAGTLTLSAANTHTATFPATGNDTVAMLGVANVFTHTQTVSSALAENGLVVTASLAYGSDQTYGQTYADSEHYSTRPGSKAFDNLYATDDDGWITNGAHVNVWVSVQFSASKVIRKITVRNGQPQSANRGIKNAKLEGSNDGSSWTKISANGWSNGATAYNTDEFTLANNYTSVQVVLFSNSTAYLYYRIFGYDSYGSSYTGLLEVEMMETGATTLKTTYDGIVTVANMATFDNNAATVTINGASTFNSGITSSVINPLTTIAESWIGPSALTGVYFKSGYVGLNNITPAQNLDVSGNAVFGTHGTSSAQVLIGQSGGYPGIWFGAYTSSINTSNYSFLFDSANAATIINAPLGGVVSFRINNVVSGALQFDKNNNLAVGATGITYLANQKLDVLGSACISGSVGIGTISPGSLLHAKTPGDVIGIQTIATLEQARSSAGANLDGGAIALNGKSSTTAAQQMAAINWTFTTATHASLTSKIVLQNRTNAGALTDRIAADGSSITLSGSQHGTYTTTAIDLTLDATHHFVTVTAAKTITLPTAATCTGREYIIKAVANNVIIDGNASETIDGNLTATLINGECYQIKSDGANWHVV